MVVELEPGGMVELALIKNVVCKSMEAKVIYFYL
jgi:hypothetical protein